MSPLASVIMKSCKSACKNYFVVLLLVICCGSVFSQDKKQLAGANEPKLITAGLHNEQLIRNIFLGKFLDIPYDRDEPSFSILLDVYISAYSNACGANLPADKVELTYQECDQGTVTRNGYGKIINTNCFHWATIHTYVYASPEMYHAKTVTDNLQAGDVFRTMFKMLKNENPIGEAADLVQKGMEMKEDVVALISMNGCKSAGLKRFEDNLRLFALNKQPIVIESIPGGKSNADVLTKNQNFKKLIDDLIDEQSAKWAMNRYKRQSVSNVSVTLRDNHNRPAEITADYQFQGWGGQRTGSVRLTFAEGLPDCMYFFDFPTTCRTPDRRLVAKYAEGSYQIQ